MANMTVKKISNNLLELDKTVKELVKNSNGLKVYDELCNEKSLLERQLLEVRQDLDKKNGEISDMRIAEERSRASLQQEIEQLTLRKRILTEEYQDQCSIWTRNKDEFSKATEEMSKLRRQQSNWRQKAEDAEAASGQLLKENENLLAEAATHKRMLRQLERNLQMEKIQFDDASAREEDYNSQLAKAHEDVGILMVDPTKMLTFLRHNLYPSSLTIEQDSRAENPGFKSPQSRLDHFSEENFASRGEWNN